MVQGKIILLCLINIFIGFLIFYVGTCLHELGHYIIAKNYKIRVKKIELNIFKGAKVTIEEKDYNKLNRDKKFYLLISGWITQWIFYFVLWILVFFVVKDYYFIFFFSIFMVCLIVLGILIDSSQKNGDLVRGAARTLAWLSGAKPAVNCL